jgi:hypothetical protein|nr:MAG TPA: hypothetical protein [Caudoviricetes sp.]
MDLENIGMSAFDAEFLQMLNQKIFKKGFDKGYDAGFTAALCTIGSVAKKESAEDALKYAEDFINGPLANEEAKTRFDKLADLSASLGLGDVLK